MSGLQITSPTELSIELTGGPRFAIHPLWLRERCRDAKTIDLHTGQRWQDPSDWDPQLALTSVAEVEPDRYRVRFSDGHEADFIGREILAEAALPPGDHDCPVMRLWDGSLEPLPRVPWEDSPAEEVRLGWLEHFLELGFIIFTGVPTQPEMVLRVASRFGYVRDTNFGPCFDVRSTPDAIDLAYTSIALDPHTDNPYRSPVPGVQLLHCLINETSGGLSTLVDGFAAAQFLREHDRSAFDRLVRTPVRFRFRDASSEFIASAPLIEADGVGRLQSINFSPRLDYVPLQSPQELAAFFSSRRALDQLLRSPRFEIRFLLNSGDLLMMDNRRLLHGRTRFDPAEGLRHLQGCYIDIDGPRSQYRVLRRRVASGRTA
ncbi:MAG TPA: TauD/TfdA family dioxygenase [Steroidobacteraceae bacterium]|nr:TauD/TfdA family dioxygenase [Steroidobacteraceae bacterium]